MVFENYSIQNSILGIYWQHTVSNALSSNTFEVSNIYNCNIIGVYCLSGYRLFVAFR